MLILRRFVITVRHGAGSELHRARLRLERRPELLKEGAVAALWAILDKLVDDYGPWLGDSRLMSRRWRRVS